MAANTTAYPVMEMVQAQLEASRQLADAVFAGTERIDRMMIDVTHRAFNEQMRFTQAAIAARDVKQVAELQSSFIPRPDAITGYQKEILDVFIQMQSEISQSMQQYMRGMAARTANVASAARATDVSGATSAAADALNPMAGMMSVWKSALREVSALADRNLEAARSGLASTMAAGLRENAAAQEAATGSGTSERKGSSGSRHK